MTLTTPFSRIEHQTVNGFEIDYERYRTAEMFFRFLAVSFPRQFVASRFAVFRIRAYDKISLFSS